jgi:uncharacterized protein (UPF0248 family)
MKQYIYIKIEVSGFHEPKEEMDAEVWRIGTTWADYEAGMWIRLTDEQAAFHEAHPEASHREVIDMRLAEPPERTLEQAKAEKLAAIEAYDVSEVNRFFLKTGGMTIPAWFDAQQRATFQTSINSRRKLIASGMIASDVIMLPVAGRIMPLPIDTADIMLAQLQDYADEAYGVTYIHRVKAEALTDIAAVDAYDHAAGYPERLTFEI